MLVRLHDSCKPFVIGSIAILDRAAKVLGKELKYNKISEPEEAKYEFGVVDVLETGDYDTDSFSGVRFRRWLARWQLTGL